MIFVFSNLQSNPGREIRMQYHTFPSEEPRLVEKELRSGFRGSFKVSRTHCNFNIIWILVV